MRRPLALATSVLLAGTLLASCGDDDSTMADDMPGESTPVADTARRIEVVAEDFTFEPDEITAEVGEDLAVVFASEDLRHDFTIDELDVHVVADRGETAEGGLRADEAGEFTFYCSVPGHRSAGMEGTLVVG